MPKPFLYFNSHIFHKRDFMNTLLKSQKTYTPGGIGEILTMSLPMIVSNACDTLMIFTDRLFLARVSPEAMNAALGAGMTYFLLTTFFVGLVSYSTALVAQYFGAKRKNYCSIAFTQALIIAVIAAPIILAMRPVVHWYFASVGLSPIQLSLQLDYFNITCWAAFFSLARGAFAGFFAGIGRTQIVMISTVTAMVTNIVATYILIFGKFGLPVLGVKGAALGTIIGLMCSLAVFVPVYLSKENRLTYQVAQSLKFVPQIMKKLLYYGSPTGFEFFISLIAFTGIVMVFHAQGDVVATATTIMFNWDLVAFLPLVGIEVSVMSLVGRYMGAQTPAIAKKAAFSGMKLGLIYSLSIFLAFMILPGVLVSIFTPNAADPIYAAASPLAVHMLRIAGLYVIANVFVLIFIGTLRGAGDTIFPMITSIATSWIALGVVFCFMQIFHLHPLTAWFGFAAIFMLSTLAYLWRFKQGKWQKMRVIEH